MFHDVLRHRESIASREHHVECQYVRAKLAAERDSLVTVPGLADHLEIVV